MNRTSTRGPHLLLSALVVGSALFIGAVHPPTAATAGLLAAIFALWVIAPWRAASRMQRPPVLFWALLAAGGWSLIQTVPLGGTVELFSGQVSDLWDASGTTGSSLSGNLAATRLLALKCLMGAVLLLGALDYLRRDGAQERLIDLVITSACIVAAVGFVQSWLGSEQILFVYQPEMGPVRPGLRGPFVNPDHFGAYTAVGALLAVGRGVTLQVHRSRFAYYAAAAALIGCLALSFSLSAMVGFAVGLIALIGVWVRRDRQTGDVAGVVVSLIGLGAFVAAAGFMLSAAGDPATAVREQLAAAAEMGATWRHTASIALASPITGVGSGTIVDLLGARLGPPPVSVWFARNQVLQCAADIGLPLCGLMVFGALGALRQTLRRWPSEYLPTALPLCAALVGLLAVSLMDFALEIPAIGIVAVLLIASVISTSRQLRGKLAVSSARPRRLALVAGVVGTVLAGSWAVLTYATLSAASARLSAVVGAETDAYEVDLAALDAAAHDVLAVRPGWGRTYAQVGRAYLEAGEPERAITWLTRSVQLIPFDAHSLGLLALAEVRAGDLEAAGSHFRTAIAHDSREAGAVLRLLARVTDDVDVWADVGTGPVEQGLLFDELLGTGRAMDALRLASELLNRQPDSSTALAGGGHAAMILGLVDLAEYYATQLERRGEPSAAAEVIRASVALQRGWVDVSQQHVDRALELDPDNYDAWFTQGEILTRQLADSDSSRTLEERMRQVRDRLRPVALSDPHRGPAFHGLSARFYLGAEQWRAAASAAQHALEAGAEEGHLYRIRGLALLELGRLAEAEADLQRALELQAGDPDTRAALEQLTPGTQPDEVPTRSEVDDDGARDPRVSGDQPDPSD